MTLGASVCVCLCVRPCIRPSVRACARCDIGEVRARDMTVGISV